MLAMLMRFKQICNHPAHWLGDGAYCDEDSGKFARLSKSPRLSPAARKSCSFSRSSRKSSKPSATCLPGAFGRPGLVAARRHGCRKTQGARREFQDDERAPFFVLSLKAGGAGLNLTAASHVVHFDRWWNPAVENQATDRAFRIGQKRNVLVHKFVCRGTIEEKIDNYRVEATDGQDCFCRRGRNQSDRIARRDLITWSNSISTPR